MPRPSDPSVVYIIDPGASEMAAEKIARELAAITGKYRLKLIACSAEGFDDTELPNSLENTLMELGLKIEAEQTSFSADTVIIHAPDTLVQNGFSSLNIVARKIIVIADECFTRPGGALAFDVDHCLDQIDRATLALHKIIAPVSAGCRASVEHWLNQNNNSQTWSMSQNDWFPICDFELSPPNKSPSDRRARRSPPDLHYFPSDADLALMFPAHAEKNTIVGARHFGSKNPAKPFWNMIQSENSHSASFFNSFDFMVYFTSPIWHDCFPIELMRAIAAGKIVISDAMTAADFKGALTPAESGDVDSIIAAYIAKPASYTKQVKRAQSILQQFSPEKFRSMFGDFCGDKSFGSP